MAAEGAGHRHRSHGAPDLPDSSHPGVLLCRGQPCARAGQLVASEEVGRHGGAEATGSLADFIWSFVPGMTDVLTGGLELREGMILFGHHVSWRPARGGNTGGAE